MISPRMVPKDRATICLLATLTLCGLAAANPCASAPASAGVSQLSGGMVYVEAGRKDGLLEGDTLIVIRAGMPVAWLRAAYLASHRAACDTLRLLSLPKAGDMAQFTDRRLLTPAGPALPGAAGASPSGTGINGVSAAPIRKPSLSRLKGRVGLTYLLVDTDGRGRLSQAAVDARVFGTHLWGAPLDWTADVRTRRVSYDRAGGVTTAEGLTRVYRFNMSGYDASGHYFVTLGRQTASALASVSIFDGALAEARGRRWNSGLFVGAQPEPTRLGLSSDIMEMGAYVEYHQPEGSESHWSLTGGGVSSRQAGSANRDFTFAQFYYTDGGLSLSASQEIDVNRGWKRDLGEPLLSPTSTFLSASARVAPHLSARGGYDNRRNVRLYRDYITPETAFDDRFRRGAWAGLSLEQIPHLRAGADLRHSSIAAIENVNTWAASAEIYQLWMLNLAVRARLSRASGAGIATNLAVYGFGLDPLPVLHLELGGGTRSTANTLFGINDSETWQSGSMDLSLVRRAYMNLSFESHHDGLAPSKQVYSSLSWTY